MSERFTNNILLGLDTSQATNRRLHKFPRPFPHTISAKIVHVYLFLSARGSLTTFHKVHTLQTTDFPAFPKLFPCTPLRFSTVYTSHCQQVVYLQHPTRFRQTTDFPIFPRPSPCTIFTKIFHIIVYFILSARGSLTTFCEVQIYCRP